MKHTKLKTKVEAILDKMDEGKPVSIDLGADGKHERLRVTERTAVPAANAAAMAAAIEAPESVSLDLGSADEDEIIEKISAAAVPQIAAGGTLPQVVLTRDDVRRVWILHDECRYKPDNLDCILIAPQGFETDLSSIPRAFWSIIEPAELSLAAPLFHDLVYGTGGTLPAGELDPADSHTFTRAEVDALFLELMKKAGIPRWKRMAGYWAVRAFAGFAWKEN